MPSADYVIVGAGSAGCVLANRLSEDPSVRVLLLEAGGKDRHMNIKIPAAFAKQFHTKLDWDFSTEPQAELNGRRLYSPRGKGLGGSSSMNAMLYVRGRPLDYDLWEAQGAEGWGWEDVRPYFLKAENNERGASEHHAVGGPLNVANTRSPRKLTPMFLESAEAAGIPRVSDYNGPEQDGASWAQVTQKGGKRFSAADAYLVPAAKRPNLEVVTRAQVMRVELEGSRATGVRYKDKRGKEQVARASREVLLSAGAYGSPQLLMLSGIGPADHLQEVGVGVRHELDGVGQNLHDHPFLVCIFESKVGGSLLDAEHPKFLAEYLLRKTGPLTSSVGEAFAFVRTRPGLPAPDVQFHFAPAFFSEHGAETHDKHAFTVGPTLVSPKSRGHVKLASSDPTAAPVIDPNALADPDDMAAMVEGVRIARRIVGVGPLADAMAREIYPGAEAQSDSEIEADVRRRTELIYHPVGTCRIGVDDRAVVDPELKVRGIEGLRVVDASVFPVIPGGNTNAPTIMVAERAADLIRGRVQAGVPA